LNLSAHYWWPLELEKHVECDFFAFRESTLADRVELQRELLDQTVAKLGEAMRPHIAEIVGRDRLPHLAHAIVGWGDAQFEGQSLTDRIAAFVTSGPSGPYVPQCDPEGDFHPWQSFAYAAMAGADGDRPLGCGPHTLKKLVRNSRRLQTPEGRELGHLLFALTEYDPDPDGPPFYMEDRRINVRQLPEIAIYAHHFGTFEVCRKFHLTEGLCSATARMPGFERYRPDAAGFLDGQMTMLELFALLTDKARKVQEGAPLHDALGELRQILRIGVNLENHLFYAGHLIELAGLARLDGFALTKTQSNAVNFLLNETSRTLADWLPHLAFIECFLSLGHFRRAASLWAALEDARVEHRPLARSALLDYAIDFDVIPWSGLVPAPKPVPADAIYAVNWSVPQLREVFAAVLEAYARTDPPQALLPRGRFDHFRRIGPEHWPRSVHYELLDHGSAIGAELHLEKDDVETLKPVVRALTERVRLHFPDTHVIWDDRWYKGRGRLVVYFPDGIAADQIAASARNLIDLTYDEVDRAVQALGAEAEETS
jgi:hypothetical protein